MTINEDKSIKASLFNLIFFTYDERMTKHFQRLFSRISDKFPCRVIFIQQTENGQGKDKIQAEKVGAATNEEQFVIRSTKELLPQVAFVALPLLMPDLPIYLIWGKNPADDNVILPKLEKFATRLVYDSECDKNLQRFSQTMLAKISHLPCDFMDIDWALISGWRDVLAQIFDNQTRFDILQNCRSVEIKYNILESSLIQRKATQAIYLQGWLAGQLNWIFLSLKKDQDIFRIEYENRNEIMLTLTPIERQNLPAGTIVEIACVSASDSSISLFFDEKQSRVLVYLSTPEKCELPFSLPLANLQRGLAFMKEVFFQRANHHYLTMLKTISKVPWSEEGPRS